MGVTLLAPGPATVPADPLVRPGHGAAARVLRALLRGFVLFPLLRCCTRVRVSGARNVPDGPVVVVANHASHADTAAVLAALPRRLRGRLAPAAAADYFFGGRLRAHLSALLLGAFPFPRHGQEGVTRAAVQLAGGRSVLLFPQGTRRGGHFRPGVGLLAAGGATILPVAVRGTGRLLPPGARLPRRAAVTVTIGPPRRYPPGADPAAVAAELQATVERLGRAPGADPQATVGRPGPAPAPAAQRAVYERARALATRPAGLLLVAAWAASEALVVPIVPDLAIGLLAAAAPRRWWRLAAAGVAGTVVGGAAAYVLGAAGLVPPLLLVTGPMLDTARDLLDGAGAAGVWFQPLSAVPYKAFAFHAADHGAGLAGFLAVSAAARGARMVAVAALLGLLGAALRRWCPPRALAGVYATGAGALLVLFALGLAEVVLART